MISKSYDIVCVATSDLVTDQRMQRVCTYFSEKGLKTLLIGHHKSQSRQLTNQSYDQKRIQTRFQSGTLFYLEINIRILLLLFKLKSDRYYAVDLDTLSGVGLAGFLKRKPYIFDAHEWFTEVPELDNEGFKKGVWSIVGRLFASSARSRLTVGDAISKELEEKYKCDFLPVYNYPSYKKLNTTPKDKSPKIILYQGKINTGRGISEMIAALDLIPEVQLWIIGDGDLYDEIKMHVKESKSSHRIRLFGEVAPDKLHDITQSAWLGLNLLSSNSKSYHVSAANKVYDYIMAGVPFLSIDYPEYVTLNENHHCGYLIDAIDPHYIADSVLSILDNDEQYNAKSAACLIAKEELVWDKERIKLDRILE